MKWAILVALWWVVATFARRLLRMIPNIPDWVVYGTLLLLSAVVFVWMAKSSKKFTASSVTQSAIQTQTANGQVPPNRGLLQPGIPTLSSLLGQQPSVTFDPRDYFRRSWFSTFTAEIEHNIKLVAEKFEPQEREAFYARLIGVGLVSYTHDVTWLIIYKSQLLLLQQLSRGAMLPISEARTLYDQAVIEYPQTYANYPFERWMDYLTNQTQLVVRHPSDMLDLTYRARDFLGYIGHWGRDINERRN